MVTFNETHLKVSIADLNISKHLYFNQAQKPRFKKVLYLAKNVSKSYQPSNRKLISKDLQYIIHYQNMERNLSLIKKESDVLGLLFMGDGATFNIIMHLNI